MGLESRSRLVIWAHHLMCLGFGFYVLAFPIGTSTREIGSVVSLIGLIVYYLFGWKDSNLSRLPMRWLYFAFVALLAVKCFHSLSPHSGLYVFKHNIYKGFALFLAGIEFVRRPRDIGLLCGLFTVMGLYEGLDGVWQYIAGHDFIKGTPIYYGIRLTGSLDSPRVGNLMSIILPASFGLLFVAGERWSRLRKGFSAILFYAPALFLLAFSYTRSGWLGFAAALSVLVWLTSGGGIKAFLKCGLVIGTAFFLFVYFDPLARPDADASFLELASADSRWALWGIALDVFKHAPATGVGVNAFSTALAAYGLVPPEPIIPNVPHPHNIYLQFLAETGVTGIVLFVLFTGSFLLYALRDIIRGVRGHIVTGYWPRHMWQAVACFFAAYVGYLVTAMGAHSYFRSWWLGISMCVFGIVIGAVAASRRGPGGNI